MGAQIGPACGSPTITLAASATPAHDDDGEEPVRVAELEQARRVPEPDHAHEARHGEQAALAEQGAELVEGDEERDEVDDAERALEHEPAQPVLGRLEPVHNGIRRGAALVPFGSQRRS